MTFEKSLSADNRFSQLVIPSTLLIILTFILFSLLDQSLSWISIVILIIVYLLLFGFMYKGYKSYDIYYDNVNMYLKGYKGVLEVPFYRTQRIKMTFGNMTIIGFKFYQYKIEYSDDQNNTCEVYFWASIISSKIDEFEEEVRKHNPEFIVEHWT